MIVIIGGGLAGLSAAVQLGDADCVVLEREAEPGGLCRSRTVGEFTFDYTGHLLHLRDPEVMALVDQLLPGAFGEIERCAAIRSHGTLVPYPFQANTFGLPPEVIFECVNGFWKTLAGSNGSGPAPDADGDESFHDWTLRTFGEGIASHFMFPYNQKMWLRDLREVTADWVSWAVPKPRFEEVLKGALGLTNTGLGYNSVFRYPKRGGIGILPEAFAERVRTIRTGCGVVSVDLARRTVRTSTGETIDYEKLICTAPLASFLQKATGLPEGLADAARALDWVDVYCLNLGIARPKVLGQHWVYYPEPVYPFYRAGSPSEFSSTVAPPGTSSLYVEIAVRPTDRPDERKLADDALEGLCRAGVLNDRDEILARDLVRLSPAYVVFDRRRRRALPLLMETLHSMGVYPIGRFGGWTYSYMEAAIKDGLATGRLLSGAPEGPAPVLPPGARAS
jgi:protoporphyrinogen oxidase